MSFRFGARNAVSLGPFAASTLQQPSAIAIGAHAGRHNQGAHSIAIGANAGHSNQHQSTIVMNATGIAINTLQTESTYMAPIRPTNSPFLMTYNSTTKEVTYGDNMSGSLGIGTTSPGEFRLYVNGTSYMNGTVAMNGNVEIYGADFVIRSSGRGAGGRALVHDINNVLTLNFAGDFASTRVGSSLAVNGDITGSSHFVSSSAISYNNTADKGKWFKIATLPSRGVATFGVSWSVAGEHGYILLSCGQQYNSTPFIRIIEGNYYGHHIPQQFRLATDNASIYNDAYLEMYLVDTTWNSPDILITVWIVNKPPVNSTATLFTTKTTGTSSGFTYYQVYGYHPIDTNWNGARICLANTGNVGIGTNDPSSKFHLKDGRMDVHTGSARFNGLLGWDDASGRAQIVLSSYYSDLVIASSQANNAHGSTLTFVTTNPSNAGDYRKWVINQGNWGDRKHMLDFGYGANITNPHSVISASNTLLTLDGANMRVGIGSTDPTAKLEVVGSTKITGSVNIIGGTAYAMPNSYMKPGSLTIGATDENYGGGTSWTSNTAALMFECQTNTEIAIHDAGQRVASFLYFAGDSTNRFYVGRDMGWGTTPTSFRGSVSIAGEADLTARLCITNPDGTISHFGYSNNWNYLRGVHTQVDTTMTVSGSSLTVSGALYVGPATGSGTIYLGGGAAGDGAYDHSVIETRNYSSSETTELLIFKGNDIAGPSGPDRIRLRAAEVSFDTYSGVTTSRTTESIRMTIKEDGTATHTSGDNSYIKYGPNGWSGYLVVGASPTRINSSTAQCISTDGNLHLDGANSHGIFLGHYARNNGLDNYINSYGTWTQSGALSVSGNLTAGNNITGSEVYTNGWFRVNYNSGGLYWTNLGRGISSPEEAGNSYGNISTYGDGRSGWRGYGLDSRYCLMKNNSSAEGGIHDNTYSWLLRWEGSDQRMCHLGQVLRVGINWDRMVVWTNGYDQYGGYLYFNAAGNLGVSSDERIKEHIEEISVDKSITFLKNIKPSSYCLKEKPKQVETSKDPDGNPIHLNCSVCNCKQEGFIAQNILKACELSGCSKSVLHNWADYEAQLDKPEEERTAILGVSDRPILSHTVNVMKHLLDENQQLKNQLNKMIEINDAQNTKINELENVIIQHNALLAQIVAQLNPPT